MRFRNSAGRPFRASTRDLMALSHRVRCWKIAGEKISTAHDLLAEIDRVGDRYPSHVRRADAIRAILMSAIMDSIISIPEADSVLSNI